MDGHLSYRKENGSRDYPPPKDTHYLRQTYNDRNQSLHQSVLETREPSLAASTVDELQRANRQLSSENDKLRSDLIALTNKYQAVLHEIDDARAYLLKMIAALD